MIYGKLWCVVKPSTGIPLFLSAVAISSFAVHLALLNTAPWLKAYYAGGGKATAAATAPVDAGTATATAAAPKKP
jgi:light-harvesting protein B-800-850 alpha chain